MTELAFALIFPFSEKVSVIFEDMLYSVHLANRDVKVYVYPEGKNGKFNKNVKFFFSLDEKHIPEDVYGFVFSSSFTTSTNNKIFRIVQPTSEYIRHLVNFITENHKDCNFVILYPDDKYGISAMESFVKLSSERDIKITRALKYKAGIADFKEYISKIKNIKNFSCVFIPDSAKASAFAISQFAFFKLKKKFFGTNLWNDLEFIRVGEKYVEDAVFVDVVEPRNYLNFSQNMSNYFGVKTTTLAFIFLDIINNIDYELYDKCYNGLSGNFRFSEFEMKHDMFIINVNNGDFVPLHRYFACE